MLIREKNGKIAIKKNKEIKKNELTLLGFWIYLMSDLIIFSSLFITYFVFVSKEIQIRKNILNINVAFFETILLLLSSFFYSLINVFVNKEKLSCISRYMIFSFLFGISFITLEIYEFIELINKNYQPSKNSFLSSFFTLIGVHGIHVIIGLIWMLFMIIQLKVKKLSERIKTQLKCLGLYWHFLDIIWIFIFSFVYLIGVIQ